MERKLMSETSRFYYIAKGKWEREKYNEAVVYLNKAIDLNEDPGEGLLSEAYYLRGMAKRCLDDYESAVRDFSRAIKMHPEDPRSYHQRACLRLTLNERSLALLDFKKEIELGRTVDQVLLDACRLTRSRSKPP